MVAILRWLPELLQRSGIMPHLDPSWRIWQIRIHAVRPRRPRHGRHQNLERTLFIFFGLGLRYAILYITLNYITLITISEIPTNVSRAGSLSSCMLMSLKNAAMAT